MGKFQVNAANEQMLGGGGVDGGKHINSVKDVCSSFLLLFYFFFPFSENWTFLLSAIHRAAGPELLDACRKVPEVRRGVRCPTGEARITP